MTRPREGKNHMAEQQTTKMEGKVGKGEYGKVPIDVVVEVAGHIGEGQCRCVAMKPTDGMVRGMKAIDTGAPITVPVGKETLGRIMNVLGEPVDERGPINSE